MPITTNSTTPTSFDKQIDLEEGIMPTQTHTDAGIIMSPAAFEQMFLSSKTEVKGELRQISGNPTAIAVAGFLLCTTPLSMQLLGWHGADQLGLATVGAYFWIGGLLLTLGGIGEWIVGNSFLSTIFVTFGGFWFTFGSTLIPSYNTYGAYGADGNNIAANWTKMREFHSTFAFFLVSMVLLSTVYFIASIRTNITFVVILGCLVPCFSCLSASYFAYGSGNIATGDHLQYIGAGFLFFISLVGWYEFLALVLLSVEFPIVLPLGDLSTRIRSRTERQKAKTRPPIARSDLRSIIAQAHLATYTPGSNSNATPTKTLRATVPKVPCPVSSFPALPVEALVLVAAAPDPVALPELAPVLVVDPLAVLVTEPVVTVVFPVATAPEVVPVLFANCVDAVEFTRAVTAVVRTAVVVLVVIKRDEERNVVLVFRAVRIVVELQLIVALGFGRVKRTKAEVGGDCARSPESRSMLLIGLMWVILILDSSSIERQPASSAEYEMDAGHHIEPEVPAAGQAVVFSA
ncbi:hypothetical protein H2198_001229 [Neophaeococcomyces mojaviensis]|uniref:Uncharacterized protein n=1 Tax=Neophaeococcomyces mojaviensis TaxID=3383035 RepID=A0ACC3AHR9_9EURO|nr:hypothetical protein H2198_001229 [Knufia sp. JES_112]